MGLYGFPFGYKEIMTNHEQDKGEDAVVRPSQDGEHTEVRTDSGTVVSWDEEKAAELNAKKIKEDGVGSGTAETTEILRLAERKAKEAEAERFEKEIE